MSIHNNDQKRLNDDDDKSNDNEADEAAAPQPVLSVEDAYTSRFSRKEKWFIVCFTAFVGVFR